MIHMQTLLFQPHLLSPPEVEKLDGEEWRPLSVLVDEQVMYSPIHGPDGKLVRISYICEIPPGEIRAKAFMSSSYGGKIHLFRTDAAFAIRSGDVEFHIVESTITIFDYLLSLRPGTE
jgi:hypothetical protein